VWGAIPALAVVALLAASCSNGPSATPAQLNEVACVAVQAAQAHPDDNAAAQQAVDFAQQSLAFASNSQLQADGKMMLGSQGATKDFGTLAGVLASAAATCHSLGEF
jgi:hypothetical protein